MKIWTCERVARSIECSPQQVKRYCDFEKIPCFKTSSDGLHSLYAYRIHEDDLLKFFDCETLEDFSRVKYR